MNHTLLELVVVNKLHFALNFVVHLLQTDFLQELTLQMLPVQFFPAAQSCKIRIDSKAGL